MFYVIMSTLTFLCLVIFIRFTIVNRNHLAWFSRIKGQKKHKIKNDQPDVDLETGDCTNSQSSIGAIHAVLHHLTICWLRLKHECVKKIHICSLWVSNQTLPSSVPTLVVQQEERISSSTSESRDVSHGRRKSTSRYQNKTLYSESSLQNSDEKDALSAKPVPMTRIDIIDKSFESITQLLLLSRHIARCDIESEH